MEFLDDIKIVWKYMRKYKKAVIGTAVLAVIFAVFEAFIPYIYGRLVDIISDKTASSLVLFLLGIWVLTSFLAAVFRNIVSKTGEYMGADILSDFIYDHMSHVMNLPLTFHREKKVGEIVSRIIRAGDHMKELVGTTLFWVAPRFLTVLIGVIIMFFINWQLALGSIIVFVLSAGIVLMRAPSLVTGQKELNKSLDKSAGILNDSFLNIQAIKSSAAEEFQKSKIKEIYREEVSPKVKNVVKIYENIHLFQEIIFSFGFVVVFGYAVLLMGRGVISQGVLVMFLGYLTLTRMPLTVLLWQWLGIQRGLTSIKRANEFLDIETEVHNENGKIMRDVKAKVEYRNIGFGYNRKRPVLDHISFTALPGEKIALVGGSGEGKTTTIDLLSLYFSPDKGEILIDDVDIRELNMNFLRSIIAYVPQEIMLFNDTIKNNILYGKPEATKKEIIDATKAANIYNFIESLPEKYDTLVGERGVKLSTGQKQRLAIARAIIRNPKILVLDEATSSLDVQSEKLIQEALERLVENKTTFIIAHRLSTVRKANKILVLEKGRIIEQGTHDELIKKQGAYSKFYNLQFSKQK